MLPFGCVNVMFTSSLQKRKRKRKQLATLSLSLSLIHAPARIVVDACGRDETTL
jgi:hypothetical protein